MATFRRDWSRNRPATAPRSPKRAETAKSGAGITLLVVSGIVRWKTVRRSGGLSSVEGCARYSRSRWASQPQTDDVATVTDRCLMPLRANP